LAEDASLWPAGMPAGRRSLRGNRTAGRHHSSTTYSRSASAVQPDRARAGQRGIDATTTARDLGARDLLRRFWPLTRPYRRWLWLSIAFVCVGPPLDAAGIWLFKALVDDVLTPRSFVAFPRIAVLYLAFTAGSGVVAFGDRYLSAWVAERFVTDLRGRVFAHLHGLSLDFFERRRLGDILSRLSGDVASIESLVLSGISSLAGYILRIVIYTATLFYLEWRLALASLTVTPVFWAVSRVFSRRLKDASRASRRAYGEIVAIAEESLSNAALVQAYNAQPAEIARFDRQGLVSMRAQLRSTRLRATFSPISQLLELIGLLLVIGYGAWQLSRNELTLGELLVFMAFFGQLYSPIRGLGKFANSMSSAAASGERVVELLEVAPAVPPVARPVAIARVRGRVSFDGVCFGYPGSRGKSLDQVSFSIEPGQQVAVIGPSGAGKSTVAKLLLRYYDPDAGAVRLDGYDLRQLDLARLRENVALVMQETLVFDGTIRENILWSRPDASARAFVAAVRAADVDSFVADLPDGYDTRVGQRGRRLSGGQRQRLAIARAMLRDAPVLVLDEPTTGLDAESAERIREPTRSLMAGRTTISITHNLTAARDYDLIIVLNAGKIVQAGRHAALLTAPGIYRQLYLQQRDPAPRRTAPPGGPTMA
jgi:ATP-binding cassette, subfamily B, bacterial